MAEENETGDLPARFYECIDYLEELDDGADGMFAAAADCIRELIGMLGEAEQALEDRKPQPKIKPAQPPYPKDKRVYQTQAYKDGQSPFLLGAAMADKE